MTLEVFMLLFLVISIFTGLTVEAIKVFTDGKLKIPSNLLAGIVTIILSVIVGVFYCIMAEIAFNTNVAIYLITLIYLSWLGSMVGYDKVLQAITQIKNK